jgi:cobalamin-dependent methionine synthase I
VAQERHVIHYKIREIADYINWGYFFHAWDFPFEMSTVSGVHDCVSCRRAWINSFEADKRAAAEQAAVLYDDARAMLAEFDSRYEVRALFMLFDAKSDEDDNILLGDTPLPMLRQQIPGKDGFCRCLSDYVNPQGNDKVGLFVTSVDAEMERHGEGDDYAGMLSQTLADRLAEAAAERLHEEVRKRLWAYAPDEALSVQDMHKELFQGIRPAVGYPCLPDISINRVLDSICRFGDIGVTLTENGMMRPHASVSGLMISHPQAQYFAVGRISGDQLADYSRRRGMTTEQMKKYLARNLESLMLNVEMRTPNS